MTDLSNINEVMAEIERRAIHTDKGSFVKLDDVKRLAESFREREAEAQRSTVPSRMTPEQARSAIKRDPEIMRHFPTTPREPGRAVSAQEPQPSSRT